MLPSARLLKKSTSTHRCNDSTTPDKRSVQFKKKIELLAQKNLANAEQRERINGNSVLRRRKKNNFPSSLQILIGKKQPVRIIHSGNKDGKKSQSPAAKGSSNKDHSSSPNSSNLLNQTTKEQPGKATYLISNQPKSKSKSGNMINSLLSQSTIARNNSTSDVPLSKKFALNRTFHGKIPVSVMNIDDDEEEKLLTINGPESSDSLHRRSRVKTPQQEQTDRLRTADSQSFGPSTTRSSAMINTGRAMKKSKLSMQKMQNQMFALSPTKTMILTQAQSIMTNKSSMAQLRNTFSKLNNLVGDLKENTEMNLGKAKSIINVSRNGMHNNRYTKEMNLTQDNNECYSRNETSFESTRKDTDLIMEEVKKIRLKRMRDASVPYLVETATHSTTGGQNSLRHQPSKEGLLRVSRTQLMYKDPKEKEKEKEKEPLSHMEKLKAIEEKIRLDLSDTKLKKQSYEILSSSLRKLGSVPNNNVNHRSCSDKAMLHNSASRLTITRNVSRNGKQRFNNQQTVKTQFDGFGGGVTAVGPDEAYDFDRSTSYDNTTSLAPPILDRSKTKKEQSFLGTEDVNKDTEEPAFLIPGGSAGRIRNSTSKLVVKKSQAILKEAVQKHHPAAEDNKVDQAAATVQKKKPAMTYILNVKACLQNAAKKRGLATDKVGRNRQQLHAMTTDSLASAQSLMVARMKSTDTVHDTNYKRFEKFQLTCNRNDPSYRNWIKGRLRKVAQEEEMIGDNIDDSFLDQYFINFDPQQNSSKEKVIQMGKTKHLLGPGYYNVSHGAREPAQQMFTFERETNVLLNQSSYSEYIKENQQIAMDQARRNRKREYQRQYKEKNPKDQLVNELVNIVEEGGTIDKEDADLLIDKLREEHKMAKSTKISLDLRGSSNKAALIRAVSVKKKPSVQQSTISKVPRWGAMTFEETIENDMMVNRVKDVNQKPHSKNHIAMNIRSSWEINPNQNSRTVSPKRQTSGSKDHKREREEKVAEQREVLINKLMARENRRVQSMRLGEQQQSIKESALELFTLNTFLHQIAETYLNRYSLQHKKDAFSRRAVLLFWVIGKFKMLARTVRVRLADTKVKQVILKWVRHWRAKRSCKMKREIMAFGRERKRHSTAFLRTAQVVYSYVVHIQRAIRRFLRRKKFIMCVYNLSWVVAEKRYLIQLKKSDDKFELSRLTSQEIMNMNSSSNAVPMKVRQFYIDQYYDMAKQAYIKQLKDYMQKIQEMGERYQGKSSASKEKDFFDYFKRLSVTKQQLSLLEEGRPVFQATIDKTDLVQMIIDALRFRVKWSDIEQGQYFNSPALKIIVKTWYQRTGLRYVNLQMEENNRRTTVAKIRKAEKVQGRIRRNAIKPDKSFPIDRLNKFIATHKLGDDQQNLSRGSTLI